MVLMLSVSKGINMTVIFCSNEAETITSLDDIYQIGAFVQITELYDMGDKIRMVVLGHRRFVCCHF